MRLPATPGSGLAALAGITEQASPGATSKIRVLDSGRDAFLERAALIEAATRSVDAQYYIWNSDSSGIYLAARLHAAADRGVRVRLLVDDINVAGRDAGLARLDAHPNIEVRIYNPARQREGVGRTLNLVWEFTRLNRRMHNKSFTVDGAFTIIGGRNIGDEYFDAHPHLNFRDRDVVAAGPVADEAGAMFDAFWNSPLSLPVSAPEGAAPARTPADLQAATERLRALYGGLPEPGADARRRLGDSLARMRDVPVELVHDDPPLPSAVGETDAPQPSAVALSRLAAGVRRELLIESAYLVMDDDTMQRVAGVRGQGIRVRALTNSLASNDVTANHAAYARRRARMLESGVEISELRPDAPSCRTTVINPAACTPPHVFGLHAKTFVLDREVVYVGSLNLNLRSRYLNAESGLVIHSPEIAAEVATAIELNMEPANSWQLVRGRTGGVEWTGIGADGQVERWSHDPMTPWRRRAVAGAIAALPLEKYL